MTLPPIRKRIANIKVDAIRKWIENDLPKTPDFKEVIRVLKKQLVTYEKYKGDPEMDEVRNVILANSILDSVARIKAKVPAGVDQ
jgi:hypothetical protein